MACVYLLQFPNGKCYVGRTKRTAENRFRGHVQSAERGSRCAVHAAIRKYGPASIKIVPLAQDVSWADSAQVEIQYIEKLGTVTPTGYNMTRGGEGVVDPTGQVAAKISRALQGHPVNDRTRQQVSRAARRKWAEASPKEREKLRARMATIATDPRTRAALAKKLGSSQTRAKMSESAKARWAKRRAP